MQKTYYTTYWYKYNVQKRREERKKGVFVAGDPLVACLVEGGASPRRKTNNNNYLNQLGRVGFRQTEKKPLR